MVKQTNKQTTKVIVKIGTDVVKRKRTRRTTKVKQQRKEEEQVQPRIVPQSFGTLSSQNTALNSFSSNIQNTLQNILKSQSDLNTVVNQLRNQQRPEENEGQNAQIQSNLNLDNNNPVNYQALMNPYPDEKQELEVKEDILSPSDAERVQRMDRVIESQRIQGEAMSRRGRSRSRGPFLSPEPPKQRRNKKQNESDDIFVALD